MEKCFVGQGRSISLWVLWATCKDHFINPSGTAEGQFLPIFGGWGGFSEFHYYYCLFKIIVLDIYLKQWFFMGRWFCFSGDIISTSGDSLGCHKRGDATGIQWAQAKSTADPLQCTGQSPHHGLIQPKMPAVLRLRNPDLKQRNSWTWLSSIHETK